MNPKSSPEKIKAHTAIAQEDLYCTFHGFNDHVEGGEMVCLKDKSRFAFDADLQLA